MDFIEVRKMLRMFEFNLSNYDLKQKGRVNKVKSKINEINQRIDAVNQHFKLIESMFFTRDEKIHNLEGQL